MHRLFQLLRQLSASLAAACAAHDLTGFCEFFNWAEALRALHRWCWQS